MQILIIYSPIITPIIIPHLLILILTISHNHKQIQNITIIFCKLKNCLKIRIF